MSPAAWIVLGLVGWVIVSVPVGLAVGAVISQRDRQRLRDCPTFQPATPEHDSTPSKES